MAVQPQPPKPTPDSGYRWEHTVLDVSLTEILLPRLVRLAQIWEDARIAAEEAGIPEGVERLNFMAESLADSGVSDRDALLGAMLNDMGWDAFAGTTTNMRGIDEMHADMSRTKGRDGMLANLDRGYRAGGRAPMGYLLKKTAMDAVRNGEAVMKSQLVIDPATAPKVTGFLKARAAGVARSEAARASGLADKSVGTLVGLEENALTYAGCLTWNRRKKHRASAHDPRNTMIPRDRAEWVIREGQHEPLITRSEADAILKAREEAPKLRRIVRKPEEALLSGLLVTERGDAWGYDGQTGSYRVRQARRVSAAWLDAAVLRKIAHDATSAEFMAKVMNEAAKQADAITDDPKIYDQQLRTVTGQIKRLVDAIAAGGSVAPVRDRLAELEAERERLAGERASCAIRASQKSALRSLDAGQVRLSLSLMAVGAGEGVMPVERVLALRTRLNVLLERVELGAEKNNLLLAYRLTGAEVASPRGFEPRFIP